MATMYSLFFGVLFTALCSDNGDGSGVLVSLKPHLSFSMTRTYFFSAKKYAKNSSLQTFDTKEVHPLAIVKNLVGDKLRECKVFALEWALIKAGLMSFVKIPVFKGDLLPYGVKGSKATNSSSVHFALEQDVRSKTINSSIPLQSRLMSPVKILTKAMGGTAVRSECSSDKAWTLGRYQVSRPSGMEDKRGLIIQIASKELGTYEATGKNDGPRIEEYLRYTHLSKGYEWCASFVSWAYGKAGLSQPRNPWSPALFPKARQIIKDQCQQSDVFGIYGIKAKRINHVGLVKEKVNDYLITIEGNSNNRVESRRRHVKTIYAVADWVNSY